MASVLVAQATHNDADEFAPDERATARTPGSGLRARIEAALDLESDDPRLIRLSIAGTSVSFHVSDEHTESVTLLLDRMPPVIADGSEPAEVTIELNADQAERFSRGSVSLPPLLLADQATYSGPVRKYLMVDAVLRALLAGGAGGH